MSPEVPMKDFNSPTDSPIRSIQISKDEKGLDFVFKNGDTLSLLDDAQDCCETRFVTCDDDLALFNGQKLIRFEFLEVKEVKDGEEEHQIWFVRVITDGGDFRFCMHNVHNGFYGGFNPTLSYTQNQA